ncbi:MAG: L,D-transpeptidase [Coleofasciculaceae cyanobacterium]
MSSIKNLAQNLILLGLTTSLLLLPSQQQAMVQELRQDDTENSKLNLQNLWVFKQLKLPVFNQNLAKNSPDNNNQESISQDTNLVLKLKERRVYVYQNEKLKNSYPVAIGKAGWETPTGSYEVIDMEPNPVWEHPWTGELILEGPDNPLGARWIGFWTDDVNFIGFHGTPKEELVGQAVSHGCVRMRNQDIIALYNQVGIGTSVKVEP